MVGVQFGRWGFRTAGIIKSRVQGFVGVPSSSDIGVPIYRHNYKHTYRHTYYTYIYIYIHTYAFLVFRFKARLPAPHTTTFSRGLIVVSRQPDIPKISRLQRNWCKGLNIRLTGAKYISVQSRGVSDSSYV